MSSVYFPMSEDTTDLPEHKQDLSFSCTLPPEIWDHVIDNVYDDTKALKACSLVAKSWLPSSHFNLFATVSFHTRPERELEDIFSFLQTSSTVHTYTREVKLFGSFETKNVHETKDVVCVHVLRKVFSCLPQLIDLTMSGLFVTCRPTCDNDSSDYPKLSLSRLELVGLSARSSAFDLWQILTMAPTLIDLILERLTVLSPGRDVPMNTLEDTALDIRYATLSNLDLSLLRAVTQKVTFKNCLMLVYTPKFGPPMKEFPLIGHLICSASQSLRMLHIYAGDVAASRLIDDQEWASLNISKCTNLGTFCANFMFSEFLRRMAAPDYMSTEIKFKVLSFLPQSTRRVTLYFHPIQARSTQVDGATAFARFDWDHVEGLLSRLPNLVSALMTIFVLGPEPERNKKANDSIRTYLESINRRGRLTVEVL